MAAVGEAGGREAEPWERTAGAGGPRRVIGQLNWGAAAG